MKMPNYDFSEVADAKITDYLLSDTHAIGKHKANFFKQFGFDASEIHTFKEALLQHSEEREIDETQSNSFGKKYKLKCDLITPDERNPCIVTVWIIETGSDTPKLITAYPAN